MKLLLAVLIPIASWATTGVVQYGPTTCHANPGTPGTGTVTCTYTSNVTAGNILVAGAGVRSGAATGITSVAGTRSSGWVEKKASTGMPGTYVTGAAIWVGTVDTTGSETLTLTYNGTVYYEWLAIAELDSTVWTSTLSGTGTVLSASGSPSNPLSCGSFTPADNGALVIAMIYDSSNTGTASNTSTSPMVTEIHNELATERKIVYQDYVQTTAASITPGITDSSGGAPYSCAAIALAPASVTVRRKAPTMSLAIGIGGATPTPGADFSFVFFSDQHSAPSNGAPITGNTNYAISKEAQWNTQAYLFSGDTNLDFPGGAYNHGWNNILARNLPTLVAPGNHDCLSEDCTARESSNKTAVFDTQLGYSRVSAATWGPVTAFAGTGSDLGYYPDSTGSRSNYAVRFAVNGHKFLVISLEIYPRDTVIAWAAALAGVYTDHKVIYVTHAYLIDGNVGGNPGRPCDETHDSYCAGNTGYTGFTNVPAGPLGGVAVCIPAGTCFYSTGQYMYDHLIKLQANSFLTLSGHFIGRTPHYSSNTSTGTNGNVISQFMLNYQELGTAANNFIGRLVFHEATATFDWYIMDTTSDTAVYSILGIAWPQ